MESLSVGKMNFTRSGKSGIEANWCHANPRAFRATLRQEFFRRMGRCDLAIDAGEPSFAQWFREVRFFGKERRKRTCAPNARTENGFDAKRLRLHESGRGFDAREEALEAAESFVDAFDGRCVRKAQDNPARRTLRRRPARRALYRAATFASSVVSFAMAWPLRRLRDAPRHSGRRRTRRRAFRTSRRESRSGLRRCASGAGRIPRASRAPSPSSRAWLRAPHIARSKSGFDVDWLCSLVNA